MKEFRCFVNFELSVTGTTFDKTNAKRTDKIYFLADRHEILEDAHLFKIFFTRRKIKPDEQRVMQSLTQNSKISSDIVNKYNLRQILAMIDSSGNPGLKSVISNPSLLEYHLQKYTTKNSTDYFIHKDLFGFLSQELDYYIKNDVPLGRPVPYRRPYNHCFRHLWY